MSREELERKVGQLQEDVRDYYDEVWRLANECAVSNKHCAKLRTVLIDIVCAGDDLPCKIEAAKTVLAHTMPVR